MNLELCENQECPATVKPYRKRRDRHHGPPIRERGAIYRPLGYERVYLTHCIVADTPFHIQGDELCGHQGHSATLQLILKKLYSVS